MGGNRSDHTPAQLPNGRRGTTNRGGARMSNMYDGTHNGDLMVAALKRHRNDPVMYLGDTVLTGGEVAARISQYVQAFEARGAGYGSSSAVLALTRPAGPFILGAGKDPGFRATESHPPRLPDRPPPATD